MYQNLASSSNKYKNHLKTSSLSNKKGQSIDWPLLISITKIYAFGAVALVASKEIADFSKRILVPPSTSIKKVVSFISTIRP